MAARLGEPCQLAPILRLNLNMIALADACCRVDGFLEEGKPELDSVKSACSERGDDSVYFFSRTSSILQLAIHSNAEILKSACPTGKQHNFVIMLFQFLFLHSVTSRLVGNLVFPANPRASTISLSSSLELPVKSVLSVLAKVAISAHICPWLSGNNTSSRLARSLTCNRLGKASRAHGLISVVNLIKDVAEN